jgi:hypothetical protein
MVVGSGSKIKARTCFQHAARIVQTIVIYCFKPEIYVSNIKKSSYTSGKRLYHHYEDHLMLFVEVIAMNCESYMKH